jgi:hypothetical protein
MIIMKGKVVPVDKHPVVGGHVGKLVVRLLGVLHQAGHFL